MGYHVVNLFRFDVKIYGLTTFFCLRSGIPCHFVAAVCHTSLSIPWVICSL